MRSLTKCVFFAGGSPRFRGCDQIFDTPRSLRTYRILSSLSQPIAGMSGPTGTSGMAEITGFPVSVFRMAADQSRLFSEYSQAMSFPPGESHRFLDGWVVSLTGGLSPLMEPLHTGGR